MNIVDLFLLAIKNLSRRKIRSWLTILGVIVGISTVVALSSLSLGLENSIKEILDRLGKDTLYVYPGSRIFFADSRESFDKNVVHLIEELDSVEFVIPLSEFSAIIEYQGKYRPSYIIGIPIEKAAYIRSMGFEIDEGRSFVSSDKGKCNVILGNLLSKKAFNEEIAVGKTILINGIKCKVIGILKPTGSRTTDLIIVIPSETLKEKFNYDDIDFIFVKARDLEKAKEDIERVLERKMDKDFTIMTSEQTFQYFKQMLGIVSLIAIAIASVSLIVSAIGIMNTMYMSILERVKEIGLLKAIGAKNIEILTIFVIESGLIGLVGGIIGTVLGFIGAKVIEIIAVSLGYYLFKMHLDIKINYILSNILIFTGCFFWNSPILLCI